MDILSIQKQLDELHKEVSQIITEDYAIRLVITISRVFENVDRKDIYEKSQRPKDYTGTPL